MLRVWLTAIAVGGMMGMITYPLPVQAEQSAPKPCSQPLTTLIPQLLTDLPSYTNRVTQRAQMFDLEIPLDTYILIVGNADFDPLPLPQQQWQPTVKNTTQQVFFTTLEREYTQQRAIERQNFYWAFFVQTRQGWQLAVLYQQLGGESPNSPTSPRRDASTGSIAQGINLWLRDCQAGVFDQAP
ncbi:MAG: hypothetical protein RLZZ490_471 [Cyanobacteriota bacterium]